MCSYICCSLLSMFTLLSSGVQFQKLSGGSAQDLGACLIRDFHLADGVQVVLEAPGAVRIGVAAIQDLFIGAHPFVHLWTDLGNQQGSQRERLVCVQVRVRMFAGDVWIRAEWVAVSDYH